MSADCAYSERNGRHPRPARFVRFLALTFVAAFSISKIYPSKCGCSLKAYQDSTQPRSVLATLDGLHVATALLLKPEAFFFVRRVAAKTGAGCRSPRASGVNSL